MLETVRQIIRKFRLILPDETIVAGVSGGSDSLALLHILLQLAPRMGFRLHAATLNHQLRGAESDGDVEAVVQICREWDVPLTVGQVDVRTVASIRQLGLEMAARLARYDFLADVAYRVGASSIAVAHHADDQAETVLMHLLRGAGMKGAAGMVLRSSVPGHADLSLIRPLLRVTRADIEAYCHQRGLKPRHDSTNDDKTILRNAIRLDVLPHLERYSQHVRSALARFAELTAVEDDFVHQELQKFVVTSEVLVQEGRISVPRTLFGSLHTALQRRFLLWAVEQIGVMEETSAQLVIDAVEIGLHGKQGAIALLGGGLQLRVDYHLLYLEKTDALQIQYPMPLLESGYINEIGIPSVIEMRGFRLDTRLQVPTTDNMFCQLAIPEDARITLRTRRKGDVFAPMGLEGHTQKLSRWMVNTKIPHAIRDQIPLIVVNGLIAAIFVKGRWIISETFAVWNTLSRVIYFQFLENS